MRLSDPRKIAGVQGAEETHISKVEHPEQSLRLGTLQTKQKTKLTFSRHGRTDEITMRKTTMVEGVNVTSAYFSP